MKRNDPTFRAMVARIASGEISRRQAAAIYNVNYGTLGVWLNRSGFGEATAYKGARTRKAGRAGAAVGWPEMSQEVRAKLDAAAERVLSGASSARSESMADPEIKLSTLTIKVRKIRQARGLPGPRELVKPAEFERDRAYLMGMMDNPKKVARLAALARLSGV